MSIPAWHHVKIVCTLGPATDAPGVLPKMIDAGMDVARINMSHGTEIDHARRIARVREAARDAGQAVAMLADLPGPKFRLGALADSPRALEQGMGVTLAVTADDAASLPVRDSHLLPVLRPGQSVYLADGSIELRVTSPGGEQVRCEVVIGGVVRSGSGINVPDADFDGLVPTDADRRHLDFALSQGVEWIGVSFVQDAGDLERVRACFPPGVRALLMAKIEKRRALADLDAVVRAADGVMVARGDLGVETSLAEIALVQKRIIAVSNAIGRPVVTATQMLESMVEHEHPTRAEVTDVANAVLDGTDAVMLSGETAIGRHPAAAVNVLHRVIAATEAEYATRIAAERLRTAVPEAGDELSFAACQLVARLAAKAVVAPVHEAATATAIARFRPAAPVLMLCDSEQVCRGLAPVRGVVPLYAAGITDGAQCIDAARGWLAARALAGPGDAIVLLTSTPGAAKPDTLRVVRL